MNKMRLNKMRLKYIDEADFRYGPWNLWEVWEAYRKKKRWAQLKEGEVVLFVSKRGSQLLFCWPTSELEDGQVVLDSRRLQLRGGTWSPLRIKEYAKRVRIDLLGLEDYEKYYEEARKRKAQRRQEERQA